MHSEGFKRPARLRDNAGFTLLELLVVMGVLGILLALAIQQYAGYRSRAVDAQMQSDLKNAAVAMESYFAKTGAYPNSVASIMAFGYSQTGGVALTIAVTSPSSFILTASNPSGTQPSFTFDSSTGLIN